MSEIQVPAAGETMWKNHVERPDEEERTQEYMKRERNFSVSVKPPCDCNLRRDTKQDQQYCLAEPNSNYQPTESQAKQIIAVLNHCLGDVVLCTES